MVDLCHFLLPAYRLCTKNSRAGFLRTVGAVYEGVNELELSDIPLLAEEGWTRHQKNIAKPPLKGADGVARSASPIGRSLKRRPAKTHIAAELTTPSARNRVASRLLFDRAATPPLRGGEYFPHCGLSNSLTPSMTARFSWNQRNTRGHRPRLQQTMAQARAFCAKPCISR
jgi:hypothetical protein